jgi:hypothetical protein
MKITRVQTSGSACPYILALLNMRKRPPAGLEMINAGKFCSRMDMADLFDFYETGTRVAEIADFLCRTVEEVQGKIDEVEATPLSWVVGYYSKRDGCGGIIIRITSGVCVVYASGSVPSQASKLTCVCTEAASATSGAAAGQGRRAKFPLYAVASVCLTPYPKSWAFDPTRRWTRRAGSRIGRNRRKLDATGAGRNEACSDGRANTLAAPSRAGDRSRHAPWSGQKCLATMSRVPRERAS